MVLSEKRRATKKKCNQNYYDRGKAGSYRHFWTKNELSILFESSKCDREIAQLTGHSLKAVQSKRGKLKKH